MMDDGRIPLIVGVTGHIALREGDVPALQGAVRSELERLRRAYPHTRIALLTSLAAGGDLLCADAAEALGLPVLAALPMPREEYRKDFSAADAARFDAHCERAERLWVAEPAEALPERPSRSDYYRQASRYVAGNCHVLLALWDGGEPDPESCGTAATAGFALRRADLEADGPEVVHIFTPRGERAGRPAGEIRRLGDVAAAGKILAELDGFNALALGHGGGGTLLPEEAGDDGTLAGLEAAYRSADGLSLSFAGTYRRILALMAAASTLLMLAFLLYDEAELLWMILVCGGMLALSLLGRRRAARLDCHRRYIEYRALAEWIRVQAWLRYAGSRLRVTELLTWSQCQETAWIAAGLRALCVGPAPGRRRDVREGWALNQRDYHMRAKGRAALGLKRSERVVNTALALSAALYAAAVLFEVLFGGLILAPVAPLAGIGLYRTALKVLLGTFSAATVFIANYYGKQSLPRGLSDHEKMGRFYDAMARKLTECGQSEALLEKLAREELIENGNWVSYQRDNDVELSL